VADAPDDITVQDNPEHSRFEIRVGDEVAGIAAYHLHGTVADFTHTQIDDAFEGRGLGSRLIRAALDDTRAAGRQVLPHCPFVRAFIAKHAEYVDLVPADARGRFGL
jgi:uncharacterized protein